MLLRLIQDAFRDGATILSMMAVAAATAFFARREFATTALVGMTIAVLLFWVLRAAEQRGRG